ncbi:universal stress protein [Pseudodesulfovibrio sp. F-1]|uniref:Universal stress protein n=1 Tax=Pseudodesulfovibrio alkaliphilus TaxID=2661613 RepID=A0A7K1KND6_9BACT|nr:universal stress protein [Pseudodesulfovibrio alkaliphilus]MUM77598.1 universal stress protein [Pseudodesulfovibrio alkaliphilus]
MIIMVAMDDSGFARAALDQALKMAAAVKAEVVAVSVVPHLGLVEGMQDSMIARLESEAASLMEEAASAGSKQGVTVKTRVASGVSPADSIIDVAREIKADLIVVGHRGKSNLEKFLIGSVTNALVTYAPCSVLVVK